MCIRDRFSKGWAISRRMPISSTFRTSGFRVTRKPWKQWMKIRLIAHETRPTQTMAVLVRADERLKKEFPLLTLPVLILHGTADQNTKPSGSQHFYDRVGSSDKTLKLYEGGFHDLLNDTDRDLVMQDIQGWINAQLAATLATQPKHNVHTDAR